MDRRRIDVFKVQQSSSSSSGRRPGADFNFDLKLNEMDYRDIGGVTYEEE